MIVKGLRQCQARSVHRLAMRMLNQKFVTQSMNDYLDNSTAKENFVHVGQDEAQDNDSAPSIRNTCACDHKCSSARLTVASTCTRCMWLACVFPCTCVRQQRTEKKRSPMQCPSSLQSEEVCCRPGFRMLAN